MSKARVLEFSAAVKGLTLLSGILFASVAAAQDAAPLYVAFDFGDLLGAEDLYGPAEARRLAGQLADEAGRSGRLPYWSFRAAEKADFPRLAVRVERRPTGAYDLVATLHLVVGDAGYGSWVGNLFSVEELEEEDGLPAPSQVPARVVAAFVEQILAPERVSPNGGEIFRRLADLVPVARAAWLGPGAVDGILALHRERYAALALSKFRLLCQRADGRLVELSSKGTGERREFPGSAPPFPAIVVRHRKWTEDDVSGEMSASRLAALAEVRLSGVLLQEFDPNGLVLATAVPGAAAPSVAPSPGGAL